MVIDATAALSAYLLADAPLKALVGTRIYTPRLPKNYTAATAAISFRANGAMDPDRLFAPGAGAGKIAQGFAFRCVSTTFLSAHAIYRALYDAMMAIDNTLAAGVLIYTADEETGAQDIVDADTGWPVVLGQFTVYFRNDA